MKFTKRTIFVMLFVAVVLAFAVISASMWFSLDTGGPDAMLKVSSKFSAETLTDKETLNLVIVVNDKTFERALQLVGSVHYWHPSWTFTVFGAPGLTERQKNTIKTWAHSEFIALRDISLDQMLLDVFPSMSKQFYENALMEIDELYPDRILDSTLWSSAALFHASNLHPRVLFLAPELVLLGRSDDIVKRLLTRGFVFTTDYSMDVTAEPPEVYSYPMVHGYLHRSAVYNAFLLPLLRCAFPKAAMTFYEFAKDKGKIDSGTPSNSNGANNDPSLVFVPERVHNGIFNAMAQQGLGHKDKCNYYFLMGASSLPRDSIQVFRNIGIGGLVIQSNPNSARDYSHQIRIRDFHKLESLRDEYMVPNNEINDDDEGVVGVNKINELVRVALLVLADDSFGIRDDMSLEELPLLSHFFPSLLRTMIVNGVGQEEQQQSIELDLYLGYSVKHAIFRKHSNVDQIKGMFREVLSKFQAVQRRKGLETGELNIQIHFQQFDEQHARVPGFMWTKLMQRGYEANADVFVTALDSMIFDTQGWIFELIKPITGISRGIVFPKLNISRNVAGTRQDKSAFLFPALNKAHFEAFRGLCPQSFASGMFSGYWLANVYDRRNTILMKSVQMSLWEVQHLDSFVMKLNTRCNRADCLRFIKSEVERDCLGLQQKLFAQGTSVAALQSTCVRHLKDLNWWRDQQ